MNVLSLVRENIKRLTPYSSARDEFSGTAEVYLDANENPYPADYNRYPDPLQSELKIKISKLKGVPADQIFLGNGSDEAIDLLIRIFCEPGSDSILIPTPTYGMYRVCADVNNVEVCIVSLTSEFDLDVKSLLQKSRSSTKIIFLCSPNNPSGNLLSKEKVIDVVKSFNGIVAIDEAYIDFANEPGFLPLLSRFPNLVVLQTLSKAWGLAGLRLGIAFASPEIIRLFNKVKYPYNISSATQQLAIKKISQPDVLNQHVQEIKTNRSVLSEKISVFRFVKKIYPSEANFILVKMDQAKAVYTYLAGKKIIVRDRSSIRLCEDCLRITIGTTEENERLITELKVYEKSIVY